MAQPQKPNQPNLRNLGKLSKARAHEYAVVSQFKEGYRNKEDKTNLPPGVMIVGSQNVLSTTAGRIGARKGFTLYGQANNTVSPIVSSFDWQRHTGDERHLRSWGTVLEYLYVADDGTVTWRTLMTGLPSVEFNYTDWWDFDQDQSYLLFVNGQSEINEWSGGITTFASASTDTITKQGVKTWAEEGFYFTGTNTVVINGANYTYTGGADTITLTGVTPDPSAAGIAVGDIIHQGVKTTSNASITDLPDTFANALVATLGNQLYVGSLTNNSVYISKQNDYQDFSFTMPVRGVGEGALVTLDGAAVGLVPQEDKMYMTAGKDQWYETKLTLSGDLSNQSFDIVRLKTTAQQAAQSQAMITKIKNDVAFISNEPTLDTLGRVTGVVLTPQSTNISDPIKNDFDSYDFTGGSVFYYRYFKYVTIPAEGLVRIFNIAKNYWEAPQILPISRFAIIDGELYGHSSQVPETYKMFDGASDNGKSMEAIAMFSYNNFGTRSALKSFNAFYTEGYISSNTTLTLGIDYDIDGCATTTSYDLEGSDGQFVCLFTDNSSLGKSSLGKNPLGMDLNIVSPTLPPKFRWIKTMVSKDFFEASFSFSSVGIDQQWEVLGFGPNAGGSSNEPVSIKQ